MEMKKITDEVYGNGIFNKIVSDDIAQFGKTVWKIKGLSGDELKIRGSQHEKKDYNDDKEMEESKRNFMDLPL